MKLRHLDLFSGIMGFSLGLERTGKYETVGFCEIDPYPQALIKEKKPNVPLWPDITKLNDYSERALTSLRAGSRAKTSARQAKVLGFSMTAPPERPQPVQDCFGKWLRPFAWLDLDTGLWKTWQRSFLTDWETFLGPWPPAGIMQNGIAWEREPLAHPTIAPEHTFLPTPGAQEGRGSSRKRYKGSQNFRGAKMSEALRLCERDQIYTHPSFAEAVMGLPIGFTELETATHHASSENSQED